MTKVKVMSNQRGDSIRARARATAREKELDRKSQIESQTDRSKMMGIDTLANGTPVVSSIADRARQLREQQRPTPRGTTNRIYATERAAMLQHIQNGPFVQRIAIVRRSLLHHSCNRKQSSLKQRHNRHLHSSIRLY